MHWVGGKSLSSKEIASFLNFNLIHCSNRENSYNKAFKTDSQRLAFLVRFSFSVYGTIV